MKDRYDILESLGAGSQSATFVARNKESGEDVVLKELTLGRAAGWKEIELFERETAVLRQLRHPSIPAFVESFRGDPKGKIAFYLVQEKIEGEPLSLIAERGPMLASRVRKVLEQLLSVLEYLHAFTPPVLHRDIKPANIISKPDGSIALVDFGAVQVDTYDTMGGTTIIGTPGYMAPEQLVGKAVPASDLYSVGATAVRLLTGVAPSELPLNRMKLDWRGRTDADAAFCDLIDRLIEPMLSDRVASAAQARGLLRMGGSAPLVVSKVRPVATLPRSSRVNIERWPGRRRIRLPGMRRYPWRPETMVWISILAVALLGVAAVVGVFGMGYAQGAITLLLYGAVGVSVVGSILSRTEARKAELILDAEKGFEVRAKDTDWKSLSGPLSDVIGPARGDGGTFLLAAQDRTFHLGECDDTEQDWLEYEVVSFLREHGPGSSNDGGP